MVLSLGQLTVTRGGGGSSDCSSKRPSLTALLPSRFLLLTGDSSGFGSFRSAEGGGGGSWGSISEGRLATNSFLVSTIGLFFNFR